MPNYSADLFQPLGDAAPQRRPRGPRPAPTFKEAFLLAAVPLAVALIAAAGGALYSKAQKHQAAPAVLSHKEAPAAEEASASEKQLAAFNKHFAAPKYSRAQLSPQFEAVKYRFADSLHETNRKRDQVRFIAGLIAQSRPSISDCGSIARHIVEVSAEKHIDPFYVAAVISVESRFSATARSRVGARGLMQLMPRTAQAIAEGSAGGSIKDALNDPRLNIELGVEYLKHLEKRYQGNRSLALAAYNWGPTNLARVNKSFKRAPRSVRRYANTIIERTHNWQRHYLKAHNSATKISHVIG